MTNKEIKTKCGELYAEIKSAEDRLAEIRKICPHTETFIGNYEWASGHIMRAYICSACGVGVRLLPGETLIK